MDVPSLVCTLDFLCILGYPHQLDVENDGKVLFPKFHEYEYTSSAHLFVLRGFLVISNIIHEDVRMKLFELSLDLRNN